MAQFTVKWPNGAEITYEGDVSFAELQEFLDREELPPALRTPPRGGNGMQQEQHEELEERPVIALDPAQVEAQLEKVGARTDVERVTVLAWAAREAGAPGIDAETATRIYRELGLRMPGVWRSTFSNAATRGYIVSEGRGYWRPTSPGENYARLGQRRAGGQSRRRRTARNDEDG
jgi:hypothetical protein